MDASAKDKLKSILEWLAGTDETGWEGEIELAETCRPDMERIARPLYGRTKRFQGPERNPDALRLNRTIPHVRAMLTAMRSRNRTAALEHGRLALTAM